MTLTIDFLGDHADLVPVVARWHWDEWGADYADASPNEWLSQLAAKTRTDGPPCSWIAFVDGAPAGAVVLELDGVEPRLELKPDLSGLYVLPEYRRNGVGSALVLACEDGARRFGVTDIYLHTERADNLYARLGWQTIERTTFQGQPTAIMRRTLHEQCSTA